MNKKDKMVYWVATGLLSAMTLMGAFYYFSNYEMVSGMFISLGFPAYMVYPLGTAKILAIIAILSKKSDFLKSLAYAGLFYTFLLGTFAHIQTGEGSTGGALVALVLLIVSYHYDKKLFMKK